MKAQSRRSPRRANRLADVLRIACSPGFPVRDINADGQVDQGIAGTSLIDDDDDDDVDLELTGLQQAARPVPLYRARSPGCSAISRVETVHQHPLGGLSAPALGRAFAASEGVDAAVRVVAGGFRRRRAPSQRPGPPLSAQAQ